jgi:tRNA-specific 2-thiouridylase
MALSVGCEKVATGHYARVEFDRGTGRYKLLRGRDLNKDQSYFLWELTQGQLSRALFPLGEMDKSDARNVARASSLYTAEKAESQEICFVPDGKYSDFIDRYLTHEDRTNEIPEKGEIVDTKGRTLGEHSGIHRYTIGQRKGLGVSNEKPLYVVQIERAKNRVIVGEEEDLVCREFFVRGTNWIAFDRPPETVRARVKVRYRHEPAEATIFPFENARARVVFDEPQRAVTPGQATIFYDPETADEVLGGGWIERSDR